MTDLVERLRKTLAGIEPDDFRGDNLAIFLASELEQTIDDETLDDSGTWKQEALDATDRVLDAIHAHYATALEAKDKEIEALRADLNIVEGVFTDVCDELGCKYDNEAALEAVVALRERVKDYETAYDGLMKAKETFRAEAHRNAARAETAERELDVLSSSHRDLAKRLADMGREWDEARAALKPFSDAADSLSEDHLDRMDLWESPAGMDITAGHLRAARAVMED